MKISETDIQAARDVSVYDLFGRLGYDPPKRAGGVVNSPFREDRTASLQVGGSKNVLYDYGTSEAWDTLELVRRAKGYTFEESIGFILGRTPRKDEIVSRNGSGAGRVVAEYDYVSPEGELLFQVQRKMDSEGKKTFVQRRPDGNGGWIWGTKGIDKVIFQLPQILEAVKTGNPIFVLEGEKDCLNLATFGLIGTSNAGGANSPWEAVFSESLRGATVTVVPDADGPGEKHAREVAKSLRGIAASVKILRLPGLGAKEDFSDWQARGGTKEGFLRLAEQAPLFDPDADTPPEADLGLTVSEKVKALHPTREAAAIVQSRFSSERGRPTLRRWGETWYTFDPVGLHYRPLGIDALRKEIWLHLEAKIERPTGRMRDDLISGLLSVSGVLIDSEEIPAYLDGESGPSRDAWIDVSNGVFDSRNRELHPASESLFRLSAPSFDFDPNAGEPERFNRFLQEVGFDESERSMLYEWIGYSLIPSHRYRKALFIEGPPSSGKSTLIELIEKLHGPKQSDAVTPEIFGQQFGLSPLVGKSLATIQDGVWPRPLPQPCVARLLEIISGNPTKVEVKRQQGETVVLRAKIIMASNEPLPLDEGPKHNNLRQRILHLETKNTFEVDDDENLPADIEAELPAIFLQALEGLDRLRKRKRFPRGFEIPRANPESILLEWLRLEGRPKTESEIERSGPRPFRKNRDLIDSTLSSLQAKGIGAWVDLLPSGNGGRPTRGFVLIDGGGRERSEVV